VINSGYAWPDGQITVTVGPAGQTRRGSSLDLGIAVAILAAAGSVPAARLSGLAFIGELGLDGRMRPVPGVLAAAAAAARAGYAAVMVPAANRDEALLAGGIAVIGPDSLATAAEALTAAGPVAAAASPPAGPGQADIGPRQDPPELAGEPAARRAAEICAAGGHGVLLRGGPGPARLLAEWIPAIMPPLPPADAIEVTAIHSLAGALDQAGSLVTAPPFAAPHHTASMAAMLGGGTDLMRPGAACIAHRGALYLENVPEFDRQVLDGLRQPAVHGEVVIQRGGLTTRFPARFILVLQAGMCPCDGARPAGAGRAECSCTPLARRRYLGRLAGPLLNHIDLTVSPRPATAGALPGEAARAEPGTSAAGRVAAARDRAERRLRGTPWRVNAEIPGHELRRSFPAEPGALTPLLRSVDVGQVSRRRAERILALAWTLADLAARDQPGRSQVASALDLWLGSSR
jgi:magnesium chelatase family protein